MGLKKIEFISDEKINQSGTVHKCIVENNSSVLFKTYYFEHGDYEYSILGIDAKRNAFGYRFIVEQIKGGIKHGNHTNPGKKPSHPQSNVFIIYEK